MFAEKRLHFPILVILSLQLLLSRFASSQFSWHLNASLLNSTAELSTSWTNRPLSADSTYGSSYITPILLSGNDGNKSHFCGFYCNEQSAECLLGIFFAFPDISSKERKLMHPQLVWSANRDHPVKANATLQLGQDGNLVLADSDGTLIWSTNTTGKSISGLNLTERGNLVLFDKANRTIWQSYDNPTDSLLPGQSLVSGRKLIASISATNQSRGLFSLTILNATWATYINSDPPQLYHASRNPDSKYFSFDGQKLTALQEPSTSPSQFMKLDPDGHLRVYQWDESELDWKDISDLFISYGGTCGYPMVCGRYGICTSKGQCSCPPEENFFRPVYERKKDAGCSQLTSINCNSSQYHSFLELKNTTYFAFEFNHELSSSILRFKVNKLEDCKRACQRNCSCKAVVFSYDWDGVRSGSCLLLNEVFSLEGNEDGMDKRVFLKVQNSSKAQNQFPTISGGKKPRHVVVIGSTLAVFIGVILSITACFVLFKKGKHDSSKARDFLDLEPILPGMLTRFTYNELKLITEDFSRKLGEGGFGSVYEGTLSNGTKIAVKRLDGLGHVMESFLTEVKIVGGIHHINLVKLIGFCAEKSQRLLIYEHMVNGSLDRWIYHKNQENDLGWHTRRRIITDIAKGLAYLHSECSHKIIHLDIKPQNILLDQNFNAKISDFGMSKLIEKDKSKIETRMRGTRGYLAPEWLNSVITEKVDVYAFGIVLLEVLCGRKNLDSSQDNEDVHLLTVFERKAEQQQLMDMVDKNNEDMQIHKEAVTEMMSIAAWCLQGDFTKRPSMSLVVKSLEGLVSVETNLDYDFTSLPEVGADNQQREAFISSVVPSILSGPRLSKMVLIDLVFHHGGEWIRERKILYSRKLVHKWEEYDSDLLSFIDIVNEYNGILGFLGVQQLIVSFPSGKYYEIVGDQGIRTLLSYVNDKFDVINLFAVEDSELPVDVENIVRLKESVVEVDEADNEGSDCNSDGTVNDCDNASDYSDYDSEELEVLAKERKRAINDKLSEYKELHRFMTFKDIAEARRFISLHALANGYNLNIKKSDSKRFRVVCQKVCNFICLISGEKNCPGVSVKTLTGKHKCDDPCGNYKVSATTLAYYFKEKLQANPKYKIKDMRVDLKTAFNINASFGKCKRAKRMILEKMEGSFCDDYNKLAGYANALLESNVGSDVSLKVSLAEGKRQFLRMYICFDALKKGFKSGLRPFIGLDGTFLKGKAKGQLLCAVGQDSMNHIYPIAWAIVDKECKVTWLWFLELLQHSLSLNNGEGITLISDMQKGLIEAVKIVLPDSMHRFCMRHVEANWRRNGKRSKQMSKVVWWCAWSTYKEELDDYLKALTELSEEAKDDLLHFPIETWCRVFLDTVCKNQKVENNLAESFNSWILEARQKPIIGMLEAIRIKVMKKSVKHEKEVKSWDTKWSPKAIEMYNEYLKIANVCELNFNGDYGYEVSEGNDKHIVNLPNKSCSCRVWDLTGIPCPHAIKALLYKEHDPRKEIHWWYTKKAYLLTYHSKLQPVPGPKFWKIDPAEAMEPPPLVNLAGRPATKRKRDKDEALKRQTEWVAPRRGRVMTCSTCGISGHNARGCQKLDKMSGEGTSKSGQLKSKKQMKDKQPMKGKQSMKRQRTLIDEEDVEPSPPRFPNDAIIEDLPLTAPQPSQDSASTQRQSLFGKSFGQSIFGPSPSDREFEYRGLEVEVDVPWKPRGVSEFKSRILQRQKQPKPTGSRQIKFLHDGIGSTKSRDLYAPKGLSWKGNASITGRQLEQLRVDKLKTKKGNGKAQQ